jgi:hypothetical protein
MHGLDAVTVGGNHLVIWKYSHRNGTDQHCAHPREPDAVRVLSILMARHVGIGTDLIERTLRNEMKRATDTEGVASPVVLNGMAA